MTGYPETILGEETAYRERRRIVVDNTRFHQLAYV